MTAEETMGGYRVHPVAAMFPLIPDEDLDKMAADIVDNGLLEAIVLSRVDDTEEWQIIDGRNRYRACERAGVKPRFSANDMDPEQIGPWIISHNLHRRSLTASQRAVIAVEYERHYAAEAKARQERGVNQYTDPSLVETLPQGSRASDQAGDLLGVSGRTVRDAKYVAEHDPEELERIRQGEVTASAAAKKLRGQPAPVSDTERALRDARRIYNKNSDEYTASLVRELETLRGQS